MMDKMKTGTSSTPTLSKKEVLDLSATPDVLRIMGMKADAEGYNPAIQGPITDHGARSYALRAQDRLATRKNAAALKKKAAPLGHVESPSHEKMEAIAGLSMVQPTFDATQPPAIELNNEKPVVVTPPSPPPALKGVGSAYPVNQALVQGKTNGPISLREGNKMVQQGFSKETVQALEMASQNIKNAAATAPKEPSAPKESPAPEKEPPSVAKETKSELDDVEQDLGPLNQLDFNALGQARSPLMGQKRREEIEKRLKPLDIGDMIMKRELTQVIPIIPDKFEITLRTFNQRENLWILRYIYDFPGSALYIQELINTCRLVCGLVAINGAYLPDHRKDPGQSTETIIKEDFEKKFFHVASFPVQLVADFSVQSIWFQERVDKLFTVDALKNG